MKYSVHCQKKHTVSIDRTDTGKPFAITVDKSSHDVAIRKVREDGSIMTLLIDHKVVPIEVVRRGDGMPIRVYLKGVPFDVEIAKVASTRFKPQVPERDVSGTVHANLPGQLVDILVREGEKVEAGASLAILDAMKMENEVLSPKSGTVKKISATKNQILSKGDLILEIG